MAAAAAGAATNLAATAANMALSAAQAQASINQTIQSMLINTYMSGVEILSAINKKGNQAAVSAIV